MFSINYFQVGSYTYSECEKINILDISRINHIMIVSVCLDKPSYKDQCVWWFCVFQGLYCACNPCIYDAPWCITSGRCALCWVGVATNAPQIWACAVITQHTCIHLRILAHLIRPWYSESNLGGGEGSCRFMVAMLTLLNLNFIPSQPSYWNVTGRSSCRDCFCLGGMLDV